MLDAVEVRRDGRPVAIPGGKTAELLVRLAVEAGARVSTDQLIDDLWAGTRTNRNTLQSKAARLRRALGDPSLIVGDEDGYCWRCARRPSTLCASSPPRTSPRGRLDAGDYRGAAETTLPLEGEMLPSAGDWAAPHRTRLEEARIKLLETQLHRPAAARRDRWSANSSPPSRAPVPGAAVGAADRRALPSGPPGRRARRLSAGTSAARHRSRPRARPAAERARAPDPRPDRCAPRAGNLPCADDRARRARRGGRRRASSCSNASARRDRRAGRGRQDRAGDRDRPRALRRASGWPGSRRRTRSPRSSTR